MNKSSPKDQPSLSEKDPTEKVLLNKPKKRKITKIMTNRNRRINREIQRTMIRENKISIKLIISPERVIRNNSINRDHRTHNNRMNDHDYYNLITLNLSSF